MNWHVLWAILKRNFVSYFSNPTGYVFICVFVLLNSAAAFWPNDFFNANLANLDQLNKYFPFIMLVFIPAITMSIWAEERRQGTDELILTIPATDLDVVLGKYLAAVGIYSVALAFSMFSNFCVLGVLGQPDLGLFLATYFGYWMVGLSMLAIGMVASFFTSNLTVGFILGVIFNAPLAFSSFVEVIIPDAYYAQLAYRWSLEAQVRDFQRGVISISSISYFFMIVVVMLFLAIMLIGRRHWMGGRDGRSMLGHYAVRALSLVALSVGVTYFFNNHDFIHQDVTSEKLSSLSPDTLKLIDELETEYPIVVEAYVSPQVPKEYVQARLDLLSTLDELRALGDGRIQVQTYIVEEYSDEARLAEERYGIQPRTVFSQQGGKQQQEDIFMACAFTCGLDKVVLPFIDKGLPVEYELIRSIATVAQDERKKLGVLQTDVPLLARFNMQTMSPGQDHALISELRKQYEVEQVDPSQPIDVDKYDVLLAAQPSSLEPQAMNNFIAAVRSGQRTLIFEDPFPYPGFWPGVVGTEQPRQPNRQMMMFQRQQPPPKGDIRNLWDLLGIDLIGDEIVWQDHNPYPKAGFVTPDWVFVDAAAPGASEPFNPHEPITSGLQQMLFLYPGAVEPPTKKDQTHLEFIELATTGNRTGTIRHEDLARPDAGGVSHKRISTDQHYVVAARIRGSLPEKDAKISADTSSTRSDAAFCAQDETESEDSAADDPPADDAATQKDSQDPADAANSAGAGNEETTGPSEKTESTSEGGEKEEAERDQIDVVLVSDLDCLVSALFAMRERGTEEADIQWDLDNVTFVLNCLDVLADDPRFVDIRKRRRKHRTLQRIDEETAESQERAAEKREEFIAEFENAVREARKEFDQRIQQISRQTDLEQVERETQLIMARRDASRRRDVKIAQLEQRRDRQLDEIKRDLEASIREVQNDYKLRAVLIPPIPPLILAFFVFFHRRQQEREGVSRSRLR